MFAHQAQALAPSPSPRYERERQPSPPAWLTMPHYLYLCGLVEGRDSRFPPCVHTAHRRDLDITPPVVQALYDTWHALGRPGLPDGHHKVLAAYQPPTFTETDVDRWVRFMGQAPADLKPWLRASFPLFLELGPDRLAKLAEDCAESSKAEACRPGTGFWHLTQLLTKYASEQPPQTTEPAGDLLGPQVQTEQPTPLELISETLNAYDAPDGADCEEIDLDKEFNVT